MIHCMFYLEKPTAGESSGGLGGGAIAGIVIGILLLVLIILVVIYVLLRNKRNKRPKNNVCPKLYFHSHSV